MLPAARGRIARFQSSRPGPSHVGVSVAEEGLHGGKGGTNGQNAGSAGDS